MILRQALAQSSPSRADALRSETYAHDALRAYAEQAQREAQALASFSKPSRLAGRRPGKTLAQRTLSALGF